jgi:hypothetical protein
MTIRPAAVHKSHRDAEPISAVFLSASALAASYVESTVDRLSYGAATDRKLALRARFAILPGSGAF